MKRLFCIIGSLLICTSSVFAWNAESFLSDGSAEYQPYELDPVEDPSLDPAQVPMLMSLRDGVAVASETEDSASVSLHDLMLNATFSKSKAYVTAYYDVHASFPGTDLPDMDFITNNQYPSSGLILSPSELWGHVFFCRSDVSVPSTYIDGEFLGAEFPWFVAYPDTSERYLTISVDVSSFGSSTIELLGTSIFTAAVYKNGALHNAVDLPFSLFVDGNFVKDFTSDLGGFLYTQADPISTVSFQLSTQYSDVPVGDVEVMLFYSSLSTAEFHFLSGDLVLDGFNDQAQNDINEHQSIESEWTGSMTDNFNALDLSGFTFPGGLVAAFALITGIFNDLWNGMGDYKILYVFPLTLGVVLLLIGRISKFSGRSSSGRGGKGDDSA